MCHLYLDLGIKRQNGFKYIYYILLSFEGFLTEFNNYSLYLMKHKLMKPLNFMRTKKIDIGFKPDLNCVILVI